MKLESLKLNAAVRGVVPDSLVTVVSVQWHGSVAVELTYKTPAGKVSNELLYRHDEPRLELVKQGRPWSFDGDGACNDRLGQRHGPRLCCSWWSRRSMRNPLTATQWADVTSPDARYQLFAGHVRNLHSEVS